MFHTAITTAYEFLTVGTGGFEIILRAATAATGAFFAISGFYKLTWEPRRQSLRATLEEAGLPFIEFNRFFVPAVELAAGLGLFVGLGTVVSSLLLLAICVVACLTDTITRVSTYPDQNGTVRRFTLWFDDLLYCCEPLYILILAASVAYGPSLLSVDNLIF